MPHYFFCLNPYTTVILGIPSLHALGSSSCISYPHETSAMHPSGTSAVRQIILDICFVRKIIFCTDNIEYLFCKEKKHLFPKYKYFTYLSTSLLNIKGPASD